MYAWQDLALQVTHGSQFGAILAVAIKHDIPPPCFNGKATITSDGFIMADFTTSNGDRHMRALVCHVEDLETNIAGLIGHLDLNEADASDMLKAFQSWIDTDYRTNTGLHLPKKSVH